LASALKKSRNETAEISPEWEKGGSEKRSDMVGHFFRRRSQERWKQRRETELYPKIRLTSQVTNEASRPRKKNKKPSSGCMAEGFS